ncbi:MAG: DUF6179 domain-containing protein [Eubacteriales bacterium]
MNYGVFKEQEKSRDKFPLINRRNIHLSRYTQSLIAEALRVGMIPMELVDDIQMQIRGILENRLRELRHSPEVKVDEEYARELLDSIFYTIDTYLLGFHDPMYAINAVQAMCVEDMYREGQRALKSLICETVALSVQIKKTRISTDNTAYNATLDEEIRSYLEQYDYQYAGQAVVQQFSYPLADRAGRMHGIHFLRDYLNRLLTENRFTALFEPEEKALLFSSYAQLHETDTMSMQVNFYSVVINNALGASILGKYTGILVLTPEEVETLYGLLYRKTTRELERMTTEAIRAMITDLKPEPVVSAYVNGHAKQMVSRLIAARNAGTDATLFVPSDPKELFKI